MKEASRSYWNKFELTGLGLKHKSWEGGGKFLFPNAFEELAGFFKGKSLKEMITDSIARRKRIRQESAKLRQRIVPRETQEWFEMLKNPLDYGEGTENLSREIDEILYGSQ